MTKEELEKEAEKYINNKQKPLTKYDLVVFAEPREKEIKILGERCLQLQKDKGNLIDKVRELEQQIEKMKRCAICKYSTNLGYCKIRCNGGECNNMDKWEIKDDG